jgi:hypothetical protein
VGVTREEFCTRYPLLWHMAEDGTWDSIDRYGLLSTSSLLDLYGINGPDRALIEGQHRLESIELKTDGLPTSVVRDQAPMHEPTLAKILTDGLTPSDWYRILNERVFFWVSARRLDKLLGARRYRDRAHTIVVVETGALLDRYHDRVTLCPMNSGNTMMIAMPRGLKTFAPLDEYPFFERHQAGLEPVVELAVQGKVEDIRTVAVRVERRAPGGEPVVLWQRPE